MRRENIGGNTVNAKLAVDPALHRASVTDADVQHYLALIDDLRGQLGAVRAFISSERLDVIKKAREGRAMRPPHTKVGYVQGYLNGGSVGRLTILYRLEEVLNESATTETKE